jgi:hypothetical protein
MSTTRAALAANSALRTVLQGLVVTAVLAGWQAVQDAADPAHGFAAGAVARTALTAAGMAVLAYAGRLVLTRRAEPLTISLDALVRAGRTLLAGAAAVAVDAAVEAVRAYVLDGGPFQPARIASVALAAAGMALTAYAHRALADPSPVPSAVPPGPVASDAVGKLATTPYRRT